MSLSIKVEAINNCTSKNIKVYDRTGAVDATLNPFGYGSPNESISEIDYARIRVTPPGSTTAIELNVYPTFPNVTEIAIVLSQSNLGVAIVEGVWNIEYEVQGLATGQTQRFSYKGKTKVLVACELECCIATKLASIEPLEIACCNEKRRKEILDVLLYKSYLEAAKQGVNCGEDVNVDQILELIRDFCEGTDCGCNG